MDASQRAAGNFPEKCVLQTYAVQPAKATSYLRMWTELGRWCMKGRPVRKCEPPTDDEMDGALTEWCDFFDASGRAETIKALKAAGVEKLGDRQKLATSIAKVAKSRS